MAAQLQVAYSQSLCGSGVFAGQAYHCAVQRFPDDVLSTSASDLQSAPFCDGCPANTTLTYDHCKRHPELQMDISLLTAYADKQAAAGDGVEHLAKKRVYLYRGLEDTTYNKGSVNSTANFFRHYNSDVHSVRVASLPSSRCVCLWVTTR